MYLTKAELKKLPKLYETEAVALKDKTVQTHFFYGGCDWYGVEYDGEDLFWGYAILNNDFDNAEWGYFSYKELSRIPLIDKDRYWTPVKAVEIDKICEGMRWNAELYELKHAE